MFYTLPVNFPHIEQHKTQRADKEHDYQERVSIASHDIKCEWEQNWHEVYLILINFFDPSLHYGIVIIGSLCLDD
jgi:hypothetical protein